MLSTNIKTNPREASAVKIIDGHMHILQWERYDQKSTFDVVSGYMERNGISFVDNMCCSNNADLWAGYEPDQNILGAISKLENPNVFTHGCLYIPKDPAIARKYSFKDQLDELMEVGLDGVKICDFKPDAYKLLGVDGRLEEYDEYAGYCEKYGIHMCWHVADPDFFWDESKVSEDIKKRGWFYGDGSYPSYEHLISLAYRLLAAHPRLHVTLAHAFFKSNEPDEVEALLKANPNVTIDLAPGPEMFEGFRLNYEKWYSLFRKYSDRFIYATDASNRASDGWTSHLARDVLRFLNTDEEFEFSDGYIAKGIKLEEEHLARILSGNHEREVGGRPADINRAALKKYIRRYLPLCPDTRNKALTEEYLKKNLL